MATGSTEDAETSTLLPRATVLKYQGRMSGLSRTQAAKLPRRHCPSTFLGMNMADSEYQPESAYYS